MVKIKLTCTLMVLLILVYRNSISQFLDISPNTNIKHSHTVPNLLGGGVAIIDFDNDGFEDIYFTGGTSSDKLYKNNGNLTFTDVTEISRIYNFTRSVTTNAVSIGDINNDGLDDIFISTTKNHSCILLLNLGNGVFNDISAEAGITGNKEWAMGAAMADINKDGLLDIYVINYINNYKSLLDDDGILVGFDHECFPNNLFINQGNNFFIEMAQEYGVDDSGCGLALELTDINEDGYVDIYIANDFGEWVLPNQTYIYNKETNKYTNKALDINLSDSIYAMGIATGDINRDGYKDYYITNLGRNVLRLNNGDNTFQDITESAGVDMTKINDEFSTGWGCFFFDFDNDGWEDLFVSNGYIPSADLIPTAKIDPNGLFRNNKNNTFTNISFEEEVDFSGVSRGSVWADLDNNGYPEIIVNNLSKVSYAKEDNVNVYINHLNNNNWIGFILTDTLSYTAIVGTKVELYSNSTKIVKEILSGGSHASSNSKRLLFGLSNITHIDSLIIKWNSGSQQIFHGVDKINTYINIDKNGSILKPLLCNDNKAENYNENGTSSWGCLLTNNDITVTSFDNKSNTSDKLIYPNPVIDFLYLKDAIEELYIYDSQGLFINKFLNTGQINIDILPDGFYTVLCILKTGEAKIIKMIK